MHIQYRLYIGLYRAIYSMYSTLYSRYYGGIYHLVTTMTTLVMVVDTTMVVDTMVVLDLYSMPYTGPIRAI